MTILIGLTGSISTGKTTVGKILREKLQADHLLKEYVDCDLITHQIMRRNNDYLVQEIKRIFKEEKIDDSVEDTILDSNGIIERAKLGAYIFSRDSLRHKWNHLIHKKILHEILGKIWKNYSWSQWIPGRKQDVIIIDMPLLFETPHVRRFMKKVICVTIRDENIQLGRLLKRNSHLSEEQARARMAAQLPSEKKEQLSDYVIVNDGTLQDLHVKVDEVYNQLKKDLHLS